MLLVAVAVILLGAPALSVRYCATTVDCSDLGDLKCMVSMCPSQGICGCDRNMVAKWMGSTRMFQCVPLRKVGQRCSNMETTGACGAPNSYCNEARNTAGEWEGWCECVSGVPEHGGESCTSIANAVSDSIYGETCQADGNCINAGTCLRTSNDNLYAPVQGHQFTCACPREQKLILDYSASTPFTDRLEPKCVPKVYGDKCNVNNECGNLVCTSGSCRCSTGFSQNYYGTNCIDDNVKLRFDADCTTASTRCDGSAGLVCGDKCDWETPTTRKCRCGRGHTTSGTSCRKIDIGDDCYGDDNCNVYNNLAICVAGVCVDGAASIPTDFKVMDEENAAGAMYVTWSLLAAAIISRFL